MVDPLFRPDLTGESANNCVQGGGAYRVFKRQFHDGATGRHRPAADGTHALSGGKFHVPHVTGSEVDRIVQQAGARIAPSASLTTPG